MSEVPLYGEGDVDVHWDASGRGDNDDGDASWWHEATELEKRQ